MKNSFFTIFFLCSVLISPAPFYAKCFRHGPASSAFSGSHSCCRPDRSFISKSCRKSLHQDKCHCVVAFSLMKILACPIEQTHLNSSRSFAVKVEKGLDPHFGLIFRTTDSCHKFQNSVNLHVLYCVWLE